MTKVVGGSTASWDQFSSPGSQEEVDLAANGIATASERCSQSQWPSELTESLFYAVGEDWLCQLKSGPEDKFLIEVKWRMREYLRKALPKPWPSLFLVANLKNSFIFLELSRSFWFVQNPSSEGYCGLEASAALVTYDTYSERLLQAWQTMEFCGIWEWSYPNTL